MSRQTIKVEYVRELEVDPMLQETISELERIFRKKDGIEIDCPPAKKIKEEEESTVDGYFLNKRKIKSSE